MSSVLAGFLFSLSICLFFPFSCYQDPERYPHHSVEGKAFIDGRAEVGESALGVNKSKYIKILTIYVWLHEGKRKDKREKKERVA